MHGSNFKIVPKKNQFKTGKKNCFYSKLVKDEKREITITFIFLNCSKKIGFI